MTPDQTVTGEMNIESRRRLVRYYLTGTGISSASSGFIELPRRATTQHLGMTRGKISLRGSLFRAPYPTERLFTSEPPLPRAAPLARKNASALRGSCGWPKNSDAVCFARDTAMVWLSLISFLPAELAT